MEGLYISLQARVLNKLMFNVTSRFSGGPRALCEAFFGVYSIDDI